MIPLEDISAPACDWQRQLRDAVSSGEQLLQMLELTPEQVGFSTAAARDFPLKVPVSFVRRMRPGDPEDPLLLQVIATGLELRQVPGYTRDPVGETGDANPRPGIIHKYHGRALLIVTGACAVHCRYCFRRHFPYHDNRNSRQAWSGTLQHIAADRSIREVILSGGDPLAATDRQLSELVDLIAGIGHVRRLRIHTRLPVVIPDRVATGLLDAITRKRLQTVLVIHSNHANELDEAVSRAMQSLRERGVTLLNQSVLLAGVNDSARALANLSERLFEAGVLPYYLHLLDKVEGAAHFDLGEDRATELLAAISSRLPGYLVPRLVREVAGADSKVAVVEPHHA